MEGNEITPFRVYFPIPQLLTPRHERQFSFRMPKSAFRIFFVPAACFLFSLFTNVLFDWMFCMLCGNVILLNYSMRHDEQHIEKRMNP